ncbi:MAG: guanylate kinase [Elusimicrobia bacterium RIFOXYB2_FULL_48_7]|nr:MAG: guanylate kinase [Elusimicrobia bacterium RIFOXYB2_FULL_48_7]
MSAKTSKFAKKGLIIVTSAPSGAGKTTICRKLLKRLENTVASVSVTTRKPRGQEKNSKDYFFVSDKIFRNMASRNEFAEWALVHGHYYGTPKKLLENTINRGKNIILVIDVQGGEKIKKLYPGEVFVFIVPPSKKALRQRLIKRAQDSSTTIDMRLRNAEKEMSYARDYDYLVVNDKIDEAVNKVIAIVTAEKCRITRMPDSQLKLR